MINIRQLQKRFGEHLAVDIDKFKVNNGDLLGLVGNNGAGKTTLFRLIVDLLKADQGEVEIIPSEDNVINPSASEEWKAFSGVYLDESFLIDFLTPEEYFQFLAKVNNLSKETMEERLAVYHTFMADEILGQKKLIRDYSAGNKQKIGIVGALLHRPQLLILDEPFNFLDPSSQNHLKRLITDYHNNTNATIIISSHNLQHTIDISTRIALMEHGHIINDLTNHERSAEAALQDYFNKDVLAEQDNKTEETE